MGRGSRAEKKPRFHFKAFHLSTEHLVRSCFEQVQSSKIDPMMAMMSRSFALGCLVWSLSASTRVLAFVLPASVPSGCPGVAARQCFSSLASDHQLGADRICIIQERRHVIAAACSRLRSSSSLSMMSDDYDEDDMSFGAKAMQERTNAELQGMVDSHSIIAFIKVKCYKASHWCHRPAPIVTVQGFCG